ncbi:alpha-N-acetylneuraminide alpha-2,8-sialyltransferase-like [Glandiceps talaboti]
MNNTQSKDKTATAMNSSSNSSNATTVLFSTKMKSRQLKTVQQIVNTIWHFNITAADQTRSVFNREFQTEKFFLMTQNNTGVNTTLSYTYGGNALVNITAEIHHRLLKEMPLKPLQYKKCSIVGNSGMLLGSKCGKSIDAANFVFRHNLATTRNYSQDVGRKTHFVTCNPSILERQYSKLNAKGSSRFKQIMVEIDKNVMVYMDAFGTKSSPGLALKAQNSLKSTNIKVVFPGHRFMKAVNKYWAGHGVRVERLSSGFFIVSAAFTFCREIHLYGFWPFGEDLQGNPLLYHYYADNIIQPGRVHRMPAEFNKLLEFHNSGVIRLHIGNC